VNHDISRAGRRQIAAFLALLALVLGAGPASGRVFGQAGGQTSGNAGSTSSAALGQDITNTATPLDESALFGGESDIIKVVDTDVAATSIVELVDDIKTYPVFILEGEAAAGLQSSFVPYGAVSGDSQSLLGGVNLDSIAFTFLPSKEYVYNVELSGTFLPSGVEDLEASAYADLRASEFFRLYGAVPYDYNIPQSVTSLTVEDEGFALDELFVDAAIERAIFFRMGKQRVRWGVGNWYKPSDVLSLSAIDPDNPRAEREGPFAFKADMPFGLNHATLYVVPPTEIDELGQFSVAQRTDFVAGGFELTLAGFYRGDMAAKPRAMFLFTGALAGIDVYGENVVSWGSDRIYVESDGLGGYQTYTIENKPIFQSTLGLKYSKFTSDGFVLNLHVQGYYNGAGYADSSILAMEAAKNAIKAVDGYSSADTSATGNGRFYLAGSIGLGFRKGRGKDLVNTSFSAYALHNFSDNSTRIGPSLGLTLGSGGSRFSMDLTAVSSFGSAGSEYAPRGNIIKPVLSMNIFNQVKLVVGAPLKFDEGFALDRVGADISLYWTVLDFERR